MHICSMDILWIILRNIFPLSTVYLPLMQPSSIPTQFRSTLIGCTFLKKYVYRQFTSRGGQHESFTFPRAVLKPKCRLSSLGPASSASTTANAQTLAVVGCFTFYLSPIASTSCLDMAQFDSRKWNLSFRNYLLQFVVIEMMHFSNL